MRRRIGFLAISLALLTNVRSRAEDPGWIRLTPEGFPIGGIVADRRHPNRMFCTSQAWPAPPILLRSLDGGTTWSPSAPGLFQIQGIGIDAVAPSRLYAGGGGGIVRSDDDGATWSIARGDGFSSSTIGAIWVHPSRGGFVYASAFSILVGSSPELWHTADGGSHWDWRLGAFGELAISSSDPDIVYTTAPGHSVVKSLDGLRTFSDAAAGLPPPRYPYLVVAPSTADVVYGTGFEDGLLYRTIDGGASWRTTTAPPMGVGAIAVDASNPLKLIVGGIGGVSRSSDGGVTWTIASGLSNEPVGAVAFDPSDADTVLAATPTGLFRRSFGSLACRTGMEALCLGGRFRAEMIRRDALGPAPGRAVVLTPDAGAFWFFSENNLEVVVKVVNGGAVNGRFWVFVASLTDVEYDLQITDVTDGSVWRRHKDAGTLESIADTDAFASP